MLQCIKECDAQFGSLFAVNEDNKEPDGGNSPNAIRKEFYEYWGWIATVDEITMGQPWLEDEVYEWPYKRLLNRLAYMKDKNNMELAISRLEALNRE